MRTASHSGSSCNMNAVLWVLPVMPYMMLTVHNIHFIAFRQRHRYILYTISSCSGVSCICKHRRHSQSNYTQQSLTSVVTFLHTHVHHPKASKELLCAPSSKFPVVDMHPYAASMLTEYAATHCMQLRHLQTSGFSQCMQSELTVPTHHQLQMGFINCNCSVQCDLFLFPSSNCARHSFFP